ncbi:disease resistance RPP8-like protein 3 [Rhodamnia argentea]|uniref:Disease resistance RPP8-like protein 3 n=1 Tax=Rhodamnia argentea TaxID=178133 RepID=A0ABM3HSM2_9MYRT|nr:disease resistance RPP8-like protein 3 [Rhodamnia argentea]
MNILRPENNMKPDSDIVGREGFADKLFDQLTHDADDRSELRVISVVGERAIGKTALVRSVYDRLDIKRHFECRAWVRVLPGSGLEYILFDVLRQTTMRELKDVDRLSEQHLSEMLKETLVEQRYLVVLDNLQGVDLMKKLLISFSDSRSKNGSRVVITSNENMSSHLDPPHYDPVELCQLNEEESRRLLTKSGWTDDPELTGAILGKCEGYPLVIRLLGGLLSTVEEDPRSTLAGWVPNNCPLGESISLSYDPHPDWLRHSLLYLVLFPREFEIPVRRLFNIWHADGLLSSRGPVPERSTKDCLDALVTRNLIHVVTRKLDGSIRTCLMPGYLHDFLSEKVMDVGTWEIPDDPMSMSSRQPAVPHIAVKICPSANAEREMTVSTNTSTEPRGTRRANMPSLSLKSTNDLSCSPQRLQYIAIKMDEENRQCKQMRMHNDAQTQYVAKFFRSLMLFTTWKQGEHAKETEMLLKPLGLRGCFPRLKVLDLEHVYKPTLPKRLGRIVPNLLCLGLRWTVLDSLPKSVQHLSRLDTLDLKHTNVTSVPCSILEAGSLQHLHMNEVCLDRSVKRTASFRKSLANLKTLWGLRIEGMSPMLQMLGELTGLRKLGLTLACDYKVASRAAKSVASLTNLQSLRLRSLDVFDHPSRLDLGDMCQLQSLSNLHVIGALTAKGLQCLPRNLKILTLSTTRLEKEEDPMEVLKELTGLTCLRLLAGSYTGRSMTCTKGTFPELRVLKLWKLEELEKWTIQDSALPCLQDLEIRNCTSLERVVGLKHVGGLEEINLTGVKNAVVATVKAMCPAAVVIARELAVSPPQSSRPKCEIEEGAEKDDGHKGEGENDDKSYDDEGDEDCKEDDDEESNGVEVEEGDENDREEGDINIDEETHGADAEQENEAEAANRDGNGDEDDDDDGCCCIKAARSIFC